MIAKFEFFKFPCGEWHFKVNPIDYNKMKADTNNLIIDGRGLTLDQLAMIRHYALDQLKCDIDLFLPYVPYSRQDRRTSPIEPFTLRAYCNVINGLNFRQVFIADPHSDVTPALLNRVRVTSALDIVLDFHILRNRHFGPKNNTVVISPDAGSMKKVHQIGRNLDVPIVYCEKKRDTATGELSGCVVHADDLTGKDAVIIDDICDGGGTFIPIAKELKAKGCRKVVLYVTHGAFTKGTQVLFENGIDEIFTTNSFDQTGKYVNIYDLLDKHVVATLGTDEK